MVMEVALATVVDVPFKVTVDEDLIVRFLGTDEGTAQFLVALVGDDVARAVLARRADMSNEQMRGELADRVAPLVRDLIEEGVLRLAGKPLVWRADFPQIRERLCRARRGEE